MLERAPLIGIPLAQSTRSLCVFLCLCYAVSLPSYADKRPGDRLNIPASIRVIKNGRHKIRIGGDVQLFGLTYIDNVIHAHLLAVSKLGTSVTISAFRNRLRNVDVSLPRRPIPTSATVRLPADVNTSQKTHVEDNPESEPLLPSARNRFDQWFDLQQIPSEDQENASIPVAGQAYFISNGENPPFWSWMRAVWCEYSGYSKSMWAIPGEIALAYATVENAFCRLRGRSSTMPKPYIQLALASRYTNIEKARRLLGYEPVMGLDEGLRLAVKVGSLHTYAENC